MSEAILTFQSQLSDIMETVLKTAVHEITCLVEDSFQGEVVRSRKEVESLRQRLQWSERRWRDRERERGGKSKCTECGRTSDPSAEIKRKSAGTKNGSEEGRGIKKEKTTRNRGSCLWEALATAPSSVPDEKDSPGSISFGETARATFPDSEGSGSDSIPEKADLPGSQSISCVRRKRRRLLLTVNFSGHPDPENELSPDEGCTKELVTEYTIKQNVEELDEAVLEGGCEYSGRSMNGLNPEYQKVTVDHDLVIGEPNVSCISHEDPELRSGLINMQAEVHHDTRKSEGIQIEDVVSLSSPHNVVNHIRRKNLKTESLSVDGWESMAQANSDIQHGDQGSFTTTGNMRISHDGGNGDNQNVCIYCGKSFAYVSRLKIHLLKHTGEKPFSCVQCGKRFTVARNLERHQKIHWGDASFICAQCGKSFRRADHLKVHQRVHTGERPYCCTHCNKCFRFSGDLNTHKRVHTGEKPYCCTLCGNRFSQLRQLKSHMRVHKANLGRISHLTQ